MSLAMEIVGGAILVPALVSFGVSWLGARLLPAARERWTVGLAVAIAFTTAFVLLHGDNALVPQRHWQWLPYLAGLSAVIGAAAQASGIFAGERWLLYLALGLTGAWALVPNWPTLQPPRLVWIGVVTTYFTLLMCLLDALPRKLQGHSLYWAWLLTALTVAALVGAELSMVLGQLAGVAAFALVGYGVAAWLVAPATTMRGAIPIFVVLIGGVAFAGTIDPEPPVWGLLVAPAAPLALWLFAAGPAAKLRGWQGVVAQIVATVVWLAVAAALVILRGGGEEY